MRCLSVRAIRLLALIASLASLPALRARAQDVGSTDRRTSANEGPIRISPGARAALHALWTASLEARAERVACLGGRVDTGAGAGAGAGAVFITAVRPVAASGADSADVSALSSLRECGPPRWFGTVHTHIAKFAGRPYFIFSAPDRYVMMLWQQRWKQDGVFCILYTDTEANCEFGTLSNTSTAYFDASDAHTGF